MLSMKFVRENEALVRDGIRKKNDKCDLDRVLALDEKCRAVRLETERLKSEMNTASDEIGRLKKAKQDASEALARSTQLKETLKEKSAELPQLELELEALLLTIPNMPGDICPIGGEEANKIVFEWGEKRKFDFTPKAHWDLGAELDIVDLPRGAKISGAGFILYKSWGARLVRALMNFMLDLHTGKHGYTEVWTPLLVNRRSMTGTGQLPKFENDMYGVDKMFLIPTAEVPVTNIHNDEILTEEELPKYYCAYSACFRREAGAAGKDTRGLIRLHQFDKVELVKIVTPETEFAELEKLMNDAEEVLQLLKIPYRRKLLATGDMTFSSCQTFDLELWCPGVDNFLEVSSCSSFGDFQARRMNTRYRPKDGGKPVHVSTMNGSGVAFPRLMIAIIENYQTANGEVEVPEVLRPYFGGVEKIGRK